MSICTVLLILTLAFALVPAEATTGVLIVQRIITSAQSGHSEWLCLYALDDGGYYGVQQPIARGICVDAILIEE